MPIGDIIGMVGAGVNTAIQAGQALGIGAKKHDRRQVEQQRKLSEQQREINHKAQMDLWNATNYGAQVEHLKEAGLNPALLYGKGGGGGATVGTGVASGSAADAASTQGAQTQATGMGMQVGMMQAQLELIKAQTDKVKAEAAKTAGVDTELAGANKASVEFQNEVNKMIGTEQMAKNYGWASDKLQTESSKVMAEYEAWKAASFEGKATDDGSSPLAKAMSAGMKTTMEQLEAAKLANDGAKAGNIVKEFEAKLAEQGIHPHSPWWTKLLTDMLTKVGVMDMVGLGQQSVKQVIKQ